MTIDDILKIKWIRDEEFQEDWFDSEICAQVIANNNPLAAIFSKHGLNVLIVNNTFYDEKGRDLDFWYKDRKNAAKNLEIVIKLIRNQKSYIEKAEKFLIRFQKLKAIDPNVLKEFKKIFTSLWCIFLTDLGEEFAFKVEEKLNRSKLKENQKEEVRDYLAGLKTKLPSRIEETLNDKDILYLQLVRKHILIDNYAAEISAELESALATLLNERFNIKSKELTMHSFTDLEKLVQLNIKLTTKDIEERKSFRIMAQINGEIAMFYGKKNFEKIKSVLKNNIKANTNNFSGIVASRGTAKGYVKIIKTTKDMSKVKKGDILVASTTRPELMPALRRCAAIVTDTGGITSHAAIISRELKIPCIVGTNIATQVLRDGDLVEVNANKGVVRILK